jgi:hypothetical protein
VERAREWPSIDLKERQQFDSKGYNSLFRETVRPVVCRFSGGSRLFDLIYARLNGVINTPRIHFGAVLIWWTTPLNYGLPFDTVWARYTPLN